MFAARGIEGKLSKEFNRNVAKWIQMRHGHGLLSKVVIYAITVRNGKRGKTPYDYGAERGG